MSETHSLATKHEQPVHEHLPNQPKPQAMTVRSVLQIYLACNMLPPPPPRLSPNDLHSAPRSTFFLILPASGEGEGACTKTAAPSRRTAAPRPTPARPGATHSTAWAL